MSQSTKTINSLYCSFVDEARRHTRLDTFQMTVSTVITNKPLKQTPICVSLIAYRYSLFVQTEQIAASSHTVSKALDICLVPCFNLVLFASTTVCCAGRPATRYRVNPRADSFPRLEMRARGAQAKKVPS